VFIFFQSVKLNISSTKATRFLKDVNAHELLGEQSAKTVKRHTVMKTFIPVR
jgi:hypothetical protein